MSEKTKADSILEKLTELENKFQTGLNEIKAAKAAAQPEPSRSDWATGHKTAEELAACPNCRKNYDFDGYEAKLKQKVQADALKEQREKQKSMKEPVLCKECGEIVEREADDCPTCHGRKAATIGT